MLIQAMCICPSRDLATEQTKQLAFATHPVVQVQASCATRLRCSQVRKLDILTTTLAMAADENHTHRGTSTIVEGESGLFSAKDFPAGRLILSISRPLLSILDSENIRDACANCFLWQPSDRAAGATSLHDGKEVSLKACLGCRTNQYCSKVRSNSSGDPSCPPAAF